MHVYTKKVTFEFAGRNWFMYFSGSQITQDTTYPLKGKWDSTSILCIAQILETFHGRSIFGYDGNTMYIYFQYI